MGCQMSVTIEQDLKEIFGEIKQKLEKIDDRLTGIEIGQAKLGEKVEGLESDLADLKENIKELKGSQKAQIWTLIGIVGTALLGTVVRYIILPFPPQL